MTIFKIYFNIAFVTIVVIKILVDDAPGKYIDIASIDAFKTNTAKPCQSIENKHFIFSLY